MSQPLYVLGHAESEIRRLELQSQIFEPGAERILHATGFGSGVRVLDLGTGTGDVAQLAAKLVGPYGSVPGVDREASVLDRARSRAANAGFGNVRFAAADAETMETAETFDLVVGHYILVHQPDRFAFLRQVVHFVQPGGTILFIEPCLAELVTPDDEPGEARSQPPVPIYEETWQHVLHAFWLGGTRLSRGGGMVRAFHEAGLIEPSLLHEVPAGGPTSAIPEWIALSLRSMLHALERHGVATAAQVDIDTLVEAAWAAAKTPGPLHAFFVRIRVKREVTRSPPWRWPAS